MACKKKARQGGEVDKKTNLKCVKAVALEARWKERRRALKSDWKPGEGADHLPHFNNITTIYYEQQVY